MAPAYRHRFEPSLNLFIERYLGEITCRDAFESSVKAAETVARSQGPGHRVDCIVDMTDAKPDVDFEQVSELVSAFGTYEVLLVDRLAIIAPKQLQFGIARMFQMLSENLETYRQLRIFTDFPEARDWLDLPEDYQPDF